MTMGEFVASKAVVLVRHSIQFFCQAYDSGELIDADGKKLFLKTDGEESLPDQLMVAHKTARDSKDETVILPTAVLDFINCQVFAMKHTKEEFEQASLDDIRQYSRKIMNRKNRNLVLMLLTLIFAEIGDYIVAEQAIK